MVKENNVTLSLSKGMQQTEIGLIPADWEVKTVEEGFEICNNLRLPISDNIRKAMQGKYPYYGPTRIQDYINEYRVEGEYSLIGEDGDHFLKWSDVPMTQLTSGRFNVNNHAHLVKGKPNSTITKWFYFYFKHRDITNYLTRQGANRYKLSKSTLITLPFALPPLPEQQAIAEALSDADAWIESLEDLIAKKRLIKQGAMQELLTPKEGWEEISIIEIAEGKRDLFNDGDWVESEHIKSEGIRLIQTGNIGIGKFLNRENRKYINEKSFLDLKCKELLEGDLLICRLAEPAGRACIFPKTSDRKTITSVDVTIFRPDVKKYDRSLILYILCTDEWFKNVIEQVGGTTHKRISRGNLGLIKINLPNSLTEQNRIATILTDMDTEIEQLEQKLTKAQQIKQGMMQELLTGRVRLV